MISHNPVKIITSAICIAFVAFACSCQGINRNGHTEYPRTEAGELMKVSLPENTPNQLIPYTGFVVGFNPEHHIPNYVAWELLATETDGPIPRAKKFTTDTDAPGCPTTDDYRNSGFDRGHMAPAGDMKWDSRAMDACFMLTNICPQDKKLNSGSWAKLEEKCRAWARRDSSLIIVCGPVLSDRLTRTIGENKVTVPERFFKVILAPYADPPRAIAFIMPNSQVAGGMQAAVTTVDNVEAITGLDFFSALPEDLEAEVESKSSFPIWEKKQKKR